MIVFIEIKSSTSGLRNSSSNTGFPKNWYSSRPAQGCIFFSLPIKKKREFEGEVYLSSFGHRRSNVIFLKSDFSMLSFWQPSSAAGLPWNVSLAEYIGHSRGNRVKAVISRGQKTYLHFCCRRDSVGLASGPNIYLDIPGCIRGVCWAGSASCQQGYIFSSSSPPPGLALESLDHTTQLQKNRKRDVFQGEKGISFGENMIEKGVRGLIRRKWLYRKKKAW